jgi:NAD(P)-dependent dehydrogenase (short-subunit alcohol dehydrogenase family)
MSATAPSLKGKGVLVTGAGTGIGREIALECARAGADVALHYSQDSEDAAGAVAAAAQLGVRATAIKGDFTDLAEVERVARAAEAFLGRVDALVNNAGITYTRPLLEIDPVRYQKIFDVNVRAGYFLIQYLLPGMLRAGGGTVCNLASVHGLQGVPEFSAYAATKGAIIAYTRSLGVELAHRGVRVNAIAPGWVTVENHRFDNPDFDEEGAKAAAAARIPAGRYGYPREIAQLAVFLCSEASAFIVGQTLAADGGTTAMMSLVGDYRAQSRGPRRERYL